MHTKPEVRYCKACIAAGRRRCRACGTEVTAPGSARRSVRCEDCRRARKYGAATVTITCRGVLMYGSLRHGRSCKRVYEYTKEKLADLRSYPNTTYEPETSSILSRSCANLAPFVKRTLAIAESRDFMTVDGVTAKTVRSWKQYRELMREYNAQMVHHRRTDHFDGKRGVGPGRHSELRRAACIAAACRREVKYEIRVCLGCHRLLRVYRFEAVDQPVSWHGPCWQRDSAAHLWLQRRQVLLRSGKPQPFVNRRLGRHYSPERHGRQYRPVELTRNYLWAVRHHLGGEPLRQLAREVGCDESVVRKGIQVTMNLLPDPSVVRREFRSAVRLLLEKSPPETIDEADIEVAAEPHSQVSAPLSS